MNRLHFRRTPSANSSPREFRSRIPPQQQLHRRLRQTRLRQLRLSRALLSVFGVIAVAGSSPAEVLRAAKSPRERSTTSIARNETSLTDNTQPLYPLFRMASPNGDRPGSLQRSGTSLLDSRPGSLNMQHGPPQHVLAAALKAATCAASLHIAAPKRMVGIIDYSLPSTTKRFWVFDRLAHKVVRTELVAHGRNSGEDVATSFSNEPGSLKSSLGLFATGETYQGEHGLSMRLHGLEPSFNDLAFERAIVLHGAAYVSKEFINTHARLGRSWGCPAVSEDIVPRLVDELDEGAFLFAYYPDRKWLHNSQVLNNCNG